MPNHHLFGKLAKKAIPVLKIQSKDFSSFIKKSKKVGKLAREREGVFVNYLPKTDGFAAEYNELATL